MCALSVVDEINHFYYRMALHELQMMNGSDAFSGLSYNSLLYLNVIDVTAVSYTHLDVYKRQLYRRAFFYGAVSVFSDILPPKSVWKGYRAFPL